MDKYVKFFFYSIGIFGCYFYYGIVQEKIMKGKYGIDKESFTCVFSLVFVQCMTNWMYAEILLRTFMKQGENITPKLYLGSAAFAYIAGSVTSYEALQWVNYPTQVIGKSSKPIPVLVFGVLFGRRSYPIQKYFFVLLIVIGVVLFVYKDEKMNDDWSLESNLLNSFGMGEMLLLFSLGMDGVLGAIEERMRSEYQTKSLHMMSSINIGSIPFLGIVIAYTGEVMLFISFVQKHPTVLWELLSLSVASAQGQLFIFLMIEHFGPLPCSVVTTMRKFFTLFGSIIIFGNPISTRQMVATFIVFSALFLDAFYEKKPREVCENCAVDEGCRPIEVCNERLVEECRQPEVVQNINEVGASQNNVSTAVHEKGSTVHPTCT